MYRFTVPELLGTVSMICIHTFTPTCKGGSSFFFRKGGPITERGVQTSREIFRNLYCKWCILNQFRPSTKS